MMGEDALLCVGARYMYGQITQEDVCLPRYRHNIVASDPRGASQARCGSEHADNDS